MHRHEWLLGSFQKPARVDWRTRDLLKWIVLRRLETVNQRPIATHGELMAQNTTSMNTKGHCSRWLSQWNGEVGFGEAVLPGASMNSLIY